MVYQVYYVEPATTRSPATLHVKYEYSTRLEADNRARSLKKEYTGLDVTVGVREKPTTPPQPAYIESDTGDLRKISGEYYSASLGVKSDHTTRTPEEQAKLIEKERQLTGKSYERLYGKEVAERYLKRTEPQYEEVEVKTKEEPINVYGGRTIDATPQQITKAKAEGGRYYKGGVLYSFNPADIFTREDVYSSVYKKMGYDTGVIDIPAGNDFVKKEFRAVKPGEAVIIKSGVPLTVRGKGLEHQTVDFYPEFIPPKIITVPAKEQTATEMARSYYADQPFQMFNAWYTLEKPKPIEPVEQTQSIFHQRDNPFTTTPVSKYHQFLENWGMDIQRQEEEARGHQEYFYGTVNKLQPKHFIGILPFLPTDTFSSEVYREIIKRGYDMSAGFIEAGVIATQKAGIIGLTYFKKDTREATKQELVRSATQLTPALKLMYKESELFKPTPKGIVNTALIFGLPLLKAIPTLTKTGQAKSVLMKAGKIQAKEPATQIRISTYVRQQPVKFSIKGDVIKIKYSFTDATGKALPGLYTRVSPGYPVSHYKVYLARSLVSVGESFGGGLKTRYVILPEYTLATTPISKGFKTYYIQSKIYPSGTTYTTVFRGDIPLKTFRSITLPKIAFTEPILQFKHQQFISMPEYRGEITTRFYTSKPVTLYTPKKSTVTGLRTRYITDFLQTSTKKPAMEVYAKPIWTMTPSNTQYYAYKPSFTGMKPISIEIFNTRYEYVHFLPKQKPYITKISDFGVRMRNPTISQTVQTGFVRENIVIDFTKIPQRSSIISKMLATKKAQQVIQTPVLLQQQIQQIVAIRKPQGTSVLSGSLYKFWTPTYHVPPSKIHVTLIDMSASGIASRVNLMPKVEPTTSLIPAIKIGNELKTEIELKVNLMPKVEPITELRSKQEPKTTLIPKAEHITNLQTRLEPITDLITDLRVQLIQQPTPTTEQITDLITPVLEPPTPIIINIPGLTSITAKKPVLEEPAEPGYDVYIKRKQLKKGKGTYVSRGYVKANEEPLTRVSALGLGSSIVDTYTNRSFTIRKAKRDAVIRRDLEQRWNMLQSKFRTSKTTPNIAVEKSTYAIDSFEEKQGIPYEAMRLRKKGLINIKRKKTLLMNKKAGMINLMKTKRFNSLKARKKMKGVNKWL